MTDWIRRTFDCGGDRFSFVQEIEAAGDDAGDDFEEPQRLQDCRIAGLQDVRNRCEKSIAGCEK